MARVLARVSRWAATTKTGDLAELTDLPEQSPRWPSDHLDSRELPGAGVPAIRPLPCVRGAPQRASGGHRRGESSFAARRSGAQGRGLRRSAAGRRGRDPGRSASDAGHRRAVFRADLVGAAGAVLLRDISRRAGRGRRARAVDRRAARGARRASLEALRVTLQRGAGRYEWAQSARRVPGCAAGASKRPSAHLADAARGSGRGRRHRQLRAARGALADALAPLRELPDEAGLRWVDANASGTARCNSRRSKSPSVCANTSSRGPARGYSPPRRWRSARTSRILRRASDCPKRARCSIDSPFDYRDQARIFLPPRMPEPQHPSFARADSSRRARRCSRRAAAAPSCCTPAIADWRKACGR